MLLFRGSFGFEASKFWMIGVHRLDDRLSWRPNFGYFFPLLGLGFHVLDAMLFYRLFCGRYASYIWMYSVCGVQILDDFLVRLPSSGRYASTFWTVHKLSIHRLDDRRPFCGNLPSKIWIPSMLGVLSVDVSNLRSFQNLTFLSICDIIKLEKKG